MFLQRLLRPDGSGVALNRAWSGSYSQEAVESINARLGQICRVDPMFKFEYEDVALPMAINNAIMERVRLRHGQYPVSVTLPDSSTVTKTVFVIAPKSSFSEVKDYVFILAQGSGSRDARFLKAFDPETPVNEQPVGWIGVNGSIAFIFTDEDMFKKFQGGLQSKPYFDGPTTKRLEPRRKIGKGNQPTGMG